MADYVGDNDLASLLAVGDDDDVGDDYSGADYVGARRRRLPAAKARRLAALASSGKLPAIFLGFDKTVAANSSDIASSEANVKLRPTDFLVRDCNADTFLITSMRIGRVDLVAGSTGIPASAFTASISRPPVSAPELEAGTQANVALTNISGAAQRFIAMYTALDISKHPVSP